MEQALTEGPSLDDLLVSPAPPGSTCLLCSQLLSAPMMAKGCGHSFCKSCFTHELTVRGRCPIDRTVLTSDDLVPNRQLDDVINGLVVRCKYAVCWHGKQWVLGSDLCAEEFAIGDTVARLNHEQSCGLSPAMCPHSGCEMPFHRRDLDQHMLNCRMRLVDCPLCGAGTTFSKIKESTVDILEKRLDEQQRVVDVLQGEIVKLRRKAMRRYRILDVRDYFRLLYWLFCTPQSFAEYRLAYGSGDDVVRFAFWGVTVSTWLVLYLPSVHLAVKLLPQLASSPRCMDAIQPEFWLMILPGVFVAALGTVMIRVSIWGSFFVIFSFSLFLAVGANQSGLMAFVFAFSYICTIMTAYATSLTVIHFVKLLVYHVPHSTEVLSHSTEMRPHSPSRVSGPPVT